MFHFFYFNPEVESLWVDLSECISDKGKIYLLHNAAVNW